MTNEVSQMAGSLIASEVLKIAAEITQLKKSGQEIVNFTVGDFDPAYFPIPAELKNEIVKAYEKQHTNYPPSSGVVQLREAVAQFYERELKFKVSPNEILIAGGARPLIYTIFTTLLDPGDEVIVPVPSWNNNHYCHLARCHQKVISCKPENGFLPTPAELRPFYATASLLCLNTPLNPTGSSMKKETLKEICEDVLKVNKSRGTKKPLYIMFDQIYWKLSLGDTQHADPISLVPEIKPYVIYVDGLSKYFCGTGLRVGWALLPEKLMSAFSGVLGHIGAWAPKPEQIAAAEYLKNTAAIDSFIGKTKIALEKRLFGLYEGVLALKSRGLAIEAIRPQGGIYLSLKVGPFKKYPTNESLRKAVLEQVGVAIIPFQAFGLHEETGWFRLSMGSVSEADVRLALTRIEQFIKTN